MRTTFTATLVSLFALITLSGLTTQAAVLEGHFYAKVCGPNTIVAVPQPINARVMPTNYAPSVINVCYGEILQNNQKREVIRLFLTSRQGMEDSTIDFQVLTKNVESSVDRSTTRKVIFTANNAELGNAQFLGTYNLGELTTLQTQGHLSHTQLVFQALDLKQMVNIASDENPVILE